MYFCKGQTPMMENDGTKTVDVFLEGDQDYGDPTNGADVDNLDDGIEFGTGSILLIYNPLTVKKYWYETKSWATLS